MNPNIKRWLSTEWKSLNQLKKVGLDFNQLDCAFQDGDIQCKIEPVTDKWGKECGSTHYYRLSGEVQP